MWEAWRLDGFTWAWIVWLAAFAIVETWALTVGNQHTLTYHLRPLMVAHPLLWFLGIGTWLWLGVHFLAPPAEAWIVRSVSPVHLP